MKKVLICGLLAASFGVGSAFAGSGTADFQVTASVNSKCLSDNATTPIADFGAIDAFATTAPTDATANVVFKCTRGVKITKASVSKPTSTVAGFLYTATVDGGTKSSAGAAADAAGGTGATADGYTFKVTASMAGNQAGDVTTGVATTDDQVLTIEF